MWAVRREPRFVAAVCGEPGRVSRKSGWNPGVCLQGTGNNDAPRGRPPAKDSSEQGLRSLLSGQTS